MLWEKMLFLSKNKLCHLECVHRLQVASWFGKSTSTFCERVRFPWKIKTCKFGYLLKGGERGCWKGVGSQLGESMPSNWLRLCLKGDMWVASNVFFSIMDMLPGWQLGGPSSQQLGYTKDIDVKLVSDIHIGKATLCDFHLIVLAHH
jgi:hypothetical protein